MTIIEAQAALDRWRFQKDGVDIFGRDAKKLSNAELLKLATFVADVKRLASLKNELSEVVKVLNNLSLISFFSILLDL